MENASRRSGDAAGRMRHAVTAWGPAVAVMGAIFVTSSIENVTEMPGGLSDKTVHFLAYGLLGTCLLWALADARLVGVTGRRAFQAWAGSAVYGATDEWHQAFVPGRTVALDDWLADGAGAAVAVVLMLALCAWGRRGRAV
jgi:VanZ family protein